MSLTNFARLDATKLSTTRSEPITNATNEVRDQAEHKDISAKILRMNFVVANNYLFQEAGDHSSIKSCHFALELLVLVG